jgi:outer membrane lipoprotein SlyB
MPMPRIRRPPVAIWSVDAIRATSAGWRFMTLSTNGATVTFDVWAAAMARIVQHSTTGTVLSPRPMKWSQHQRPA